MKWYSEGRRVQASFKDQLSKQVDALKRLRAAISGDGEYLSDVFGYADAKLTEVRENGHPTAGGLVVAKDQEHAKKIAGILEDVTEEAVFLAISEDAAADRVIKRFAADDCRTRWLVAVKMVSEGVDIPRLRVGVYATNVLTELFFRQVVGRFVRTQEGLEDQTSYLYLPADDVLVGYAQAIKQERQHQLQDELDRIRREREIAAHAWRAT
jgi:superfamily II DNA or RNA helicase